MPFADFRAREQELVRRCLSGDAGAWEEFVRTYGPSIERTARRILRHYGGPETSAPDLTQEALASLCDPVKSPLARFQWQCSLPSYLSAVAARRALEHLRGGRRERQRLQAMALIAELELSPPLTWEGAGGGEAAQAVRQALDRLPPRERLVLQMVYWDALPAKRVARIVGVTRERIWQVQTEARQRLRSLLKGLHGMSL